MNKNDLRGFLTAYICSLLERTRAEKGTLKIGFDWLIYQLAFAKGWRPVRLPFFRQSDKKVAKTKSEAEFGVDACFLGELKTDLYVFVLKDEILNNKNWTKHNFDSDLRMAATIDVKQYGLNFIKSVKVILAYNKDEDENGIRLYQQCANFHGTKIGDFVSLSFERWNLDKIVEEVQAHLTPDLLPQHVSGSFRYVCSLVEDFKYGTTEWDNLVAPKWRHFLNLVLENPVDERKLKLIPVALMIIHHYQKDVKNFYPAWIDLIEWAMLSLWKCYKNNPNKKQKKMNKLIAEIWKGLYIAELEKYFLMIEPVLTAQHAFSAKRIGTTLAISPINDAYLAYWHIGRLGILTLAPQDFQINAKNDVESIQIATVFQLSIKRSADWLIRCLNINPAALRPLLDLNHIELFLIWAILLQAGRKKDIYEWLSELEGRLLMRRAKMNIPIPFIEANSRMDLVAEYAATGKKPYNFSDSSSYLLLMILELCFSLPDSERDELLNRYMKRIVKGIDENNHTIAQDEIDLQSWVPPDDWSGRILKEPVWDGIAITTGNFERLGEKVLPLSESIKQSVDETRKKYPWKIPERTPLAVYILACIKHRSPLPPEFWRETIFRTETNDKK
ncbi:MAG: hypothetical protein A2Y10_19025 [Planctomycetes bacterium GWF2_41_51]|nr:MAG: hypothetical protein A2Y10_19025 [Planctomycetes bacterium GWF2_41_51]HBG27398.1 hypothetical protein [Phycisphaerales bacterium]